VIQGTLAHAIIDWVVRMASNAIAPAMFFIFAGALLLRALIYYTVRREDWFAREFEKRIGSFMEKDNGGNHSFYVLTKQILERTFYELFEIRGIMKRRKMDYIMSPGDRLFLIHNGAARLVRDTLKQVKFLRYGEQHPKFLEISKSVYANNPCFNKVFGIIPISPCTDFLNSLPGLFVVAGIFGTFLGIMKALPELGGMNLNDVDGTKQIMDLFLLRVSFSMSTSVCGIMLSVLTQVVNVFISPEKLYLDIVNRYELSLEYLWRRCNQNTLPEDIPDFDEHRDPIEALAEFSVARQLAQSEGRPIEKRLVNPNRPKAPEPDPDPNDEVRKAS
jgi:hypothetical protein